uniref:Uncharacterized protein n=1 Tax=Arundo donax TaxID=35708 RepID=A0A0A8ZJM4_ARUDO
MASRTSSAPRTSTPSSPPPMPPPTSSPSWPTTTSPPPMLRPTSSRSQPPTPRPISSSAWFFPKNVVHSVQPYALLGAGEEAGAPQSHGDVADLLLGWRARKVFVRMLMRRRMVGLGRWRRRG